MKERRKLQQKLAKKHIKMQSAFTVDSFNSELKDLIN